MAREICPTCDNKVCRCSDCRGGSQKSFGCDCAFKLDMKERDRHCYEAPKEATR